MKSFFKNVQVGLAQRKGEGVLIGKVLRLGQFSVRVENHIGEGGFASIYRVRDTTSGQAFALKHMRLAGDQECIRDMTVEVQTMMALRGVHNVLKLVAVGYGGPEHARQEAYLLMDLCKDSLPGYMTQRDFKLKDFEVVDIFRSVCLAVSAMHDQDPPMAHRDLKAENVLLHENDRWVLCDYGSVSTWAGVHETSNQIMIAEDEIRRHTTAAYRAPEMWDLYNRERMDTKVDIWALGCLLYYLSFGKLPFGMENKLQILNGDFQMPTTRPAVLRQIIRQALTVKPSDRPSVDSILQQLEPLASSLGLPPAASTSRRQTVESTPTAPSEPEAPVAVPVAVYTPAQSDAGSAQSSQTAAPLIDTSSDSASSAAPPAAAAAAAAPPQARPPPTAGRHPGGLFFAQQQASSSSTGAAPVRSPPSTPSLPAKTPSQRSLYVQPSGELISTAEETTPRRPPAVSTQSAPTQAARPPKSAHPLSPTADPHVHPHPGGVPRPPPRGASPTPPQSSTTLQDRDGGGGQQGARGSAGGSISSGAPLGLDTLEGCRKRLGELATEMISLRQVVATQQSTISQLQEENAALRSQQRAGPPAGQPSQVASAPSPAPTQPTDATWIAFEDLSPSKAPTSGGSSPFQQPRQTSHLRPEDDPFQEGGAFSNGSASGVASPSKAPSSPAKRQTSAAGITSPKAALLASVQAAAAASAAAERTSSFGVATELSRPARMGSMGSDGGLQQQQQRHVAFAAPATPSSADPFDPFGFAEPAAGTGTAAPAPAAARDPFSDHSLKAKMPDPSVEAYDTYRGEGDDSSEISSPIDYTPPHLARTTGSSSFRDRVKNKFGGKHRRTTSEPTPVDSWHLGMQEPF